MAQGIRPQSLTGRELARAGQALMGQNWKRPFARWYGVDIKTLFRWLQDKHPAPPALAPRVYLALRERAQEIERVRAALRSRRRNGKD